MSRLTTIDGRRFAQFVCGKCGIEHWVPEAFYDEQVKLGPSGGWYCPNGHGRVFRESAADQLRRERDRLQQQLARKDDAIAYQRERRERAERSAAAYKGQTTRLKKRAKPDVHLQRLADLEGVCAQALCERLAKETGYRVATVETLIWRACANGILISRTGEIRRAVPA